MRETAEFLRSLFDAAVAAALPALRLPARLPDPPIEGRVIVLAAGKAAGAMAETAERHYVETLGLEPGRLTGLAVTRHGHGRPTRLVSCIEAGHPVPDAAGLAAAERCLGLAAAAGPEDLVLVLLSGGGSANWVLPVAGVSLAAKQAVTRALLKSGAPIDEINTVRKHLSRIKGSRLAAAARPARLVTLAISDVPRDDPSVIASGPTVPDPTTLADARAILRARGIDPPESVARALADPANETPKPGDPAFAQALFEIVSRPSDALAAAAAAARAHGYDVVELGADLEGEARDVAAEHARLALDLAARRARAVILSGGELTVTVRGTGRGGPNQEYALGLALALAGAPAVSAIAGDSDGADGGSGRADDPAGAMVFPDTLARAAARGLDPAASLADNDAAGFFGALGDLVVTGPTLTNVNDVRAIVVDTGAA